MQRIWLAALLCLAAVVTPRVWAQATDGNIVGAVSDATGASVANVAVELTNLDTGVRSTANTDNAGQYRFNNVPAGRYKILGSATGFTTGGVQNVAVESNRTATVNLTLQVGQVSTAVEVVDAAAVIDTTTARVQTTYETKAALQLPTSGTGTLGVINLSLLSAGVTSSGGVGYGTGPSVGGQRPTNNNFMLEGVDNNIRSVTGPIISVSNEAVAQFTLQQNQFSPEFGHSSGGQFNTILRSGTNEVHGSIYEYLQNRNLNAVDEQFARQGIRSNPRNDQNRLGGTIGGPILRNKLFYFGNFEYLPQGQAATNAGAIFVPTAEGIRRLEAIPTVSRPNLAVFKEQVPVAATETAGAPIVVAGQSIPVGLLTVAAPSFINDYRAVASGDYNLSDRDQIRARWVYFRQDAIDTVANLPQFFQPSPTRAHVASLTHFHTFTPSITNELRAAYNRRTNEIPAGEFAFPGLDAFPNVNLLDLGLIIGPNQNAPQGNRSNTFQLVENLNWVVGRHTLKFGYDGRKLNITNFFIQRNRGEYRYNTLERYLLDITPEFAQRSIGGFPFIGNLLSHYAYVNDDWRIRPDLTLNLGLRYEFVDTPAGAKAQSLNSVASVPGLIEFRSPKPTKRDFAPRVGLAYSPGGRQDFVIRAGFGMSYDQVYQNLGTNSLPPQFFTTIDAHADAPNLPNFLANGGIRNVIAPVTDAAKARDLTSSFIPDQLRPYSLQWNLGVQKVLANDYTVEVRYLGTRGVHLPFQTQLNRVAAVTTLDRSLPTYLERPSQAELDRLPLTLAGLQQGFNSNSFLPFGFTKSITAFMPVGNSSYHGLATQVTKRFSQGLQFTGAYTWSHNIDDSTSALFSTVTTPRRPQDFQNLRAERASSALDRRHRFTLAYLYDAPWLRDSRNWFAKNLVGNWTLGGTYTAETGPWATPQSSVDANLNSDNAGDRTILNPAGDAGRGTGVTALRNTANQIVGYLANDPTARYIAAGQGTLPTAGRNTLRLPGVNNWDLTAMKRFNVTESKFFEFRGEFYNAFNHPQYSAGFPSAANPRARVNGAALNLLIPSNPNFNRPDLAFQSNARVIQVVGRFQF